VNLPCGRYRVDVLVPGVINWQHGQEIEFPTPAPDRLPPRSSAAGNPGEAWATPVLRLAGTNFRSDQ
jgi:hypothetical protein